ncbi:hypothetical protein CONLIGDRAFT_621388 [Coniochaeta ligniaria NRRL 30616]|uniref:DUF4470 domain-containing protein n=1 Tax=Coniochaeta ligniaria NRRL 30616 TaxID=1408157 RepID=A0A1J7J706_9PEZI|nr:hypothetical protein CONLIGDRAFT_621388 [Coniochaeta ligniaria NRRL 30616]
MASQNQEALAEEARKQGVEFRDEQGNFEAASVAFTRAASLAPGDPAPLISLLEITFEFGQYSKAARLIKRSLDLLETASDDEKSIQYRNTSLYNRLARCYVYESRFDLAGHVLDNLSDHNLRSCVRATVDFDSPTVSSRQHALRKLVFDRLPRYQAHLQDAPAYQPMGHDLAQSLFDDALLKSSSPQDTVSLMFGGSGDARHLFTTIISLAPHMARKPPVCKDVHITIVDLNPTAIARTLILIGMVMLYATSQTIPSYYHTQTTGDQLVMIAYIYAGHVIPASVDEALQHHINELVTVLATDEPLFGWLFVPTATRKAVVHVLKQWLKPLKAAYHQTGTPGFEKDEKTFNLLGVLLPSTSFAARHDPQLVQLMKYYDKSRLQFAAHQLTEHIDATWVTNRTLLDIDLDDVLQKIDFCPCGQCKIEDMVPRIESNPIYLGDDLPKCASESEGVLDYVGQFFDSLAVALLRFELVSSQLKVEVLVGEMTDTMERLRWGCLEARSKPAGGIDPSTFPRVYDRIHMSNIPDYVGGFLTAAMYGRPLLREDKPSNLRFMALPNPPRFPSQDHFLAEYALMYDGKLISDHFRLARPADSGPDKSQGRITEKARAAYTKWYGAGALKFTCEDYMDWDRVPAKKLSFDDLLDRESLEKWLYALFLKICLPYPRDRVIHSELHAPLNLTLWIRLVAHLSEVGYSAHWLSQVLFSLCGGLSLGGDITTTARPPQRAVTRPFDVDKVFLMRKMTVDPWRAEFTTLLSIWSRLMPFAFLVPPRALVAPADIAEFSVSFPAFKAKDARLPHFVLLFWDSSNGDALLGDLILRDFLRGDGHGYESLSAEKIRRHSIHIFSAVKYVTATRTATFWCRRDLMRMMRHENWKVFIWRIDTWQQVTAGVVVKDGVAMIRLWNQ